jgi:hypothetical protein
MTDLHSVDSSQVDLWKLELAITVPLKEQSVKLLLVKVQSVKEQLVKEQLVKVDLLKLTYIRSTSSKCKSLNSAPVRSASDRSIPAANACLTASLRETALDAYKTSPECLK